MKKIILVGVVLATALTLKVFAASAAEVKNSKSETYKDIIEKAYNLSLQKDRQQALTILSTAIQKETRPQATAELKKTAGDIAHVFFSDKAQQLYETGLSLRKTDLTQALGKMNEALRIEPDNLAIVTELSRMMIAKGDCSAADDLIAKQLKLVSFDDELKLSDAQASVCQAQWLEFNKIYDPNDVRKSALQKFWLALEVEHQLKLKNYVKAQDILSTLKKMDGKYPEVSYLSWKSTETSKSPQVEDAQKYVMTCKNISASQYRQYMIDPMLCRRVSEVEAEIKGINAATE